MPGSCKSTEYMLYTFSPMKKLITFFLLLIVLGCKNPKDFRSDFEKQKFDTTVTSTLPHYDTLRQLILNNYDSFYLSNAKYNFTYIYNFDTSTQIAGYNNHDVPEIIFAKTVLLFERIGKENIFGFTISVDSTFEILIRNRHLTQHFLDVRERLYWYNNTSKIYKTEFPIKDTLLTDKWQYQIWYDKRAGF